MPSVESLKSLHLAPVERPLLLVDVDGVISLFGFDPSRPPEGRFELVDGIAHFISATAGQHLRALLDRFDLVWCTGWEEMANEYLPPALGLPGSLPHLVLDRNVGRSHAHWKLDAIDRYAAPRRPLAWIDDALGEECEAWASRRAGPTLLVTTVSSVGITGEHVGELIGWADQLTARLRP
jgi:hypothetical protein